MSQATKAGLSCVRPHCRMSWTHVMLALISSTKSMLPPEDQPLSLTTAAVEKKPAESELNKVAGPDNIPSHPSPLWQETVPSCLQTAIILLVPKSSAVSSLHNYCPVALTPILIKCFEKLVFLHIKACILISMF